MERVFYWIYDSPDYLKEVFKLSNKYYLEAIKLMVKNGVDAIIISEDLGDNKALFFKSDIMKKILFPFLEELIISIKSFNIPVIIHCDGNINEILKDLINLGIDAYHPVQKSAGMDIFNIRKIYDNKICLIGNMEIKKLETANPKEVLGEAENLILNVGKNGAYVLASEHSLNDRMLVENIKILREAVCNIKL